MIHTIIHPSNSAFPKFNHTLEAQLATPKVLHNAVRSADHFQRQHRIPTLPVGLTQTSSSNPWANASFVSPSFQSQQANSLVRFGRGESSGLMVFLVALMLGSMTFGIGKAVGQSTQQRFLSEAIAKCLPEALLPEDCLRFLPAALGMGDDVEMALVLGTEDTPMGMTFRLKENGNRETFQRMYELATQQPNFTFETQYDKDGHLGSFTVKLIAAALEGPAPKAGE